MYEYKTPSGKPMNSRNTARQGVYACRIARRNCHHWHSGGTVTPRDPGCP